MISLKEHIRRIEETIEILKPRTEHFTSRGPQEIKRMLRRPANAPRIVGFGWNDSTPGGTSSLDVGIYNPGASKASNLYVHWWIGSGIVDPTADTFVLNVDTRFPCLTEPAWPGLTVNPQSTAYLNTTLQIPATIEKTNYFVQFCLMKVGVIPPTGRLMLDRDIAVLEVA